MHDGRPAHNQDLASVPVCLDQHVGHLSRGDSLWFLGRNRAVHELERRLLRIALFRKNAYANVTDHDCLSNLNLSHRQAAGRPRVCVDHDAAVHFLVVDRRPRAIQPDFRALVCRAVETRRKCPGDVSVTQSTVVGCDGHGSVVEQLSQDFVQSITGLGLNLNQGITGIGTILTHVDLLDVKRALHRDDAVKNLRQQQAVDDMPGNFDIFHSRTGRLAHAAPPIPGRIRFVDGLLSMQSEVAGEISFLRH